MISQVEAYKTELKIKNKLEKEDILNVSKEVLDSTIYDTSAQNVLLVSKRIEDIFNSRIYRRSPENQIKMLELWDEEGLLALINNLRGIHEIITVMISRKLYKQYSGGV